MEIYVNKEINEEIVEWFDDETNKNAFYIQSFHSNDQREYLKETGHFKQYTSSENSQRLSHTKSGSNINPNFRYDQENSSM